MTSTLTTEHRVFVTLTALHLGQGPRAALLAAYCVTEADLTQYQAAWLRLRAWHDAARAPRAQQADELPPLARRPEALLVS